MADRNFTQFIPQNAAAPRRPTGKACAPWQKNRKPDTDTAGSAQKNMAFLCRTFPRVKVRRGKSPVRQTRDFPYRPGLRDGLVLVRSNDVLPKKVRLRVIYPAESRFSGENLLSAQIRPEPGFGAKYMLIGNLYGSPGLPRTDPVSAMDWFGKARVSRTERSR